MLFLKQSGIVVAILTILTMVAELTGDAQTTMAAACRIPTGLLCEGCAQHLKVKIAPNGSCQISFISATAAKFVELEVEVHHWPRRQRHLALDNRIGAAGRIRQTTASPTGKAAPNCFVFADRHYCE
jgi:hypothetical protein